MNIKNLFIAIIIIILLGAGYYFFVSKNNTNKVVYTSDIFTFADGGKKFTIQYNDDTSKAEVVFDGKKYELNVAISGSGARYTNPDESVVFWEHQGTASLEINGQNVFQEALPLKSGEETPDMSLENTEWQWQKTLYSNDKIVTPNKAEKFILSFGQDGHFSATTDCNNLLGNYKIGEGKTIEFSQIASTKKACQEKNIQEGEFTKMISESTGYLFSSEGNLVLTLKLDTGSILFTKVVR